MGKRRIDYTDVPENLNDHPFFGFELDEEQKNFRDNIFDKNKRIIFCNAKAGTGKTFVAVSTAILMYKYNLFDGIVYIVSPYGESKQGFLPGDLTTKSSVYFEPAYQAIIECGENPERVVCNDPMTNDKEGLAYITPITHTYLRGSNLKNKVVIIDEAQNYSVEDLKKTLTRIHDTSSVIVIGHSAQIDLDNKSKSGFTKYLQWFESQNDDRVAICELKTNHRGWLAQIADDLIE